MFWKLIIIFILSFNFVILAENSNSLLHPGVNEQPNSKKSAITGLRSGIPLPPRTNIVAEVPTLDVGEYQPPQKYLFK